ncbi:hypothetical protein KY363_03670 [Candidatus Woesearchaeota archaeon]|nr:hypothetical protein [Candidatus Woesearchaeota archaeon]
MKAAIFLVFFIFILGCSTHTGFSVMKQPVLPYRLVEDNVSNGWHEYRVWITADENSSESDVASTLKQAVIEEISDGGCVKARAWKVSENEYEGVITCKHSQE